MITMAKNINIGKYDVAMSHGGSNVIGSPNKYQCRIKGLLINVINNLCISFFFLFLN